MKQSMLFKLLLAAFLVLLLAGLFGCGDSGPRQTVDTFMSGAQSKDCEKMVDTIDIQSLQEQDSSINRDNLLENCKQSPLDQVDSYSILDEQTDGDKSQVKVEVTTSQNGQQTKLTDTINLINRNGEWKITTM